MCFDVELLVNVNWDAITWMEYMVGSTLETLGAFIVNIIIGCKNMGVIKETENEKDSEMWLNETIMSQIICIQVLHKWNVRFNEMICDFN